MLFASWRHGPLPRSQNPFFISDLEFPLPFQNQVDLVLVAMDISLLFLARFKTIDIAEKPWALKDVVLLHLLRGKLLIIREINNLHLSRSLSLPLSLFTTTATSALRCSTARTIESTGTRWRDTPKSLGGIPIARPNNWGRCRMGRFRWVFTARPARS